MRETEKILALDGIYRAEARCFLRYVVEEAASRAEDDFDRKAEGLLEAWCRDSRSAQERLHRLLVGQERHPAPGGWPLLFSQYHFLRYGYLLDPVRERMKAHADHIEAAVRAVGRWPEAEDVVREAVAAHRRHLEAADALVAERPAAEPATAPAKRRRERSANWW